MSVDVDKLICPETEQECLYDICRNGNVCDSWAEQGLSGPSSPDGVCEVTPSPTTSDQVNSPNHYQSTYEHHGPIECIHAIKAMLGPNYKYYAQGAALKYLWRHPYKGKPLEDLLKDRYYLEDLIKAIEEENK